MGETRLPAEGDRFWIVGALSAAISGGCLLVRLAVNYVAFPAFEGWFLTTEDALGLILLNRTAFILSATLAFSAAISMIPFFAAFYHALAEIPRRWSLVGFVFAGLGAGNLVATSAASAMSGILFADLYEVAVDPLPVVTAAQGVGALIGAGMITSPVLICMGLISFGIAMWSSPRFDRRVASIILFFGVAIPFGGVLRLFGTFTVASSLPPLLFVPLLFLGGKLWRIGRPRPG